MADQVEWPKQSGIFVQSGSDRIRVERTEIPHTTRGEPRQLGLKLSPNLTWKKKIRILGHDDREMGAVECRDDLKGPHWIIWPKTAFKIELGKDIGVFMTGMYWASLPKLGGEVEPEYDLLFTWEKD